MNNCLATRTGLDGDLGVDPMRTLKTITDRTAATKAGEGPVMRSCARSWEPSGETVIRCLDFAHRRASLRVMLLPTNMIAVLVPPGEVSLLEPEQVVQLRDVLRVALVGAAEAEDRCPDNVGVSLHCFHTAVSCLDAVGRERELKVSFVRGPLIELASPAGGTAVLQPLKVGRLRGALQTALDCVRERSIGVMQAASSTVTSEQVAV